MKYFTSKFQVVLGTLWLLVICLPNTLLLLFGTPVRVMAFTILSISTYLLFFILVAAFWKYPELTNKELEVRNVLYRFYRKHYTYDNIRKVEICRGSIYHWPCIRVYLKSGERVYWHSIDCMSQDSIPEFLRELHEHGVDAECLVEYK